MPQHTLSTNATAAFVHKNRATAGSVAKTDSSMATPANYVSHSDLDAALTAANGTYYTAARLNQMTLNDKQYALRLVQDSTQFL